MRLDVNVIMRNRDVSAYVDPSAIVPTSTTLWPFAMIGPYVELGERCVIGPGASIGFAGFKYDLEDGDLLYREHAAGVVIGDDVHIGANACVDQGRWRATEIRTGAKIDNLVHIAHNVIVGEGARVIALAEVSGSVEIGPYAVVAPGAAIREHLTIGRESLVGLGAAVVCDVPPREVWAGVPARRIGP